MFLPGARVRGVPRGVAPLAVVAALASVAHAQTATDKFGIERFRPAMDPAGVIDVDGADVAGHLDWGVGVWMGFAHDPLVIYDRTMAQVDALVDRRLTTGLAGFVGVRERLELGLGLDLVGYQSGSDTSPTMVALPSAGLGDLRLSAKVLLAGDRRLRVAIVPVFTVPGGGAGGYLRESGATFAPELAVSAVRGPVRAAANVGYVARKRVETAGLVIDDEVYVRLGLGVRLGAARAPLGELAWSTSIAAPVRDAHRNQMAIEMFGGVSRSVTRALGVFVAVGLGLDNGFGTPDWRAVVGVRVERAQSDRDGDHLAGAVDRCPDEAEDYDGFADDDGCPDPDNDGDGIADARDKCPLQAEDKDGFQDEDGCPDPDNDGDGIPDISDKCPLQAEDKDGFRDDDGCPDPASRIDGKVVDTDGHALAGATVTIAQPERAGAAAIEVAAADDGSFTATVEGGKLELTARAAEYQEGHAESSVAPGASGTVSIKLARKVRQAQLRGQVLSFDGKPLAATITVKGSVQASAVSDADGQYVVDLPAGAFDVTIEAPGYVTQHRSVKAKLDGVTVLNVDMRGAK